jgi:hypothetical protein
MEKRLKPALLAVFRSRAQAEGAIEDLLIAGFREDSVGLVSPGYSLDARREVLRYPADLGAGQRAFDRRSIVLGSDWARTAVEDSLGLHRSSATVVCIPNVGPVAASGLFAGVTNGRKWLDGCLAGTDVSPTECVHFESQVEAGKTVVGVLPEGRAILAREILERYGGELSRVRTRGTGW